MLQIMENAYVATDLQNQSAHPLNSGWMNVLHRWSQSAMLRRYWPLLRNEYSREFVFFCERELALKTELTELYDLQPLDKTGLPRPDGLDVATWSGSRLSSIASGPRRSTGTAVLWTCWERHCRTPSRTNAESPWTAAAWFVRVRMPRGGLDKGDPLDLGFVAGVVAIRPLARKLKLTGEELGRLKAKLEVDEHGDVEPQFWKLDLENPDEAARKKFGDLAEPPFLASLDKRPGHELVVWVRPGFRHLRAGTAPARRVHAQEAQV